MFSSQITSTHPPPPSSSGVSGALGILALLFYLGDSAGALFQDELLGQTLVRLGSRESGLHWQPESVRQVTPPGAPTKRGGQRLCMGRGWAWAVAAVARG